MWGGLSFHSALIIPHSSFRIHSRPPSRSGFRPEPARLPLAVLSSLVSAPRVHVQRGRALGSVETFESFLVNSFGRREDSEMKSKEICRAARVLCAALILSVACAGVARAQGVGWVGGRQGQAGRDLNAVYFADSKRGW